MALTPVCVIDAAGIYRPDFATVLAFWQAQYRGLYGDDVVLDDETQDGQWVSLIALAFHEANGETVAAYESRSPASAQGAGLWSLVKINGLRAHAATFSTVDTRIVGQAGIEIVNGSVSDDAGNDWLLPASFLIPDAGEITVTATCSTAGAIVLPPGAIDTDTGKGSFAVQYGWQSATNPAAAATGQPVESDSALRQRQAVSTAIPSQSLLEGLYGTLLAVTGVVRCRPYENDTDYPDANGLPGHSICMVIDGGDAAVIADIIRRKKGNAGTYGTTLQQVTDAAGIVRNIRFSRSVEVPVSYAIQVRKLGSYTAKTDLDLRTSVSDFTNALGIGNSVGLDDAEVAAKFDGAAEGLGYRIVSLAAARNGNVPLPTDVTIAYDERATCTPNAVVTTVLP